MQNAYALLRQASRIWVFVLRTTLITLGIVLGGAVLAFQTYRQTIAIVGQPASAQTILGLREPIRVTFSHPMDQKSVAENLLITPATAVIFNWNQKSTELSLVPRTQWKADSAYTVLLGPAALSATRSPIEPWSMQFNTRPVLRIAQFLPAHLSTDVATDSLVAIRFTQQMVPQSAVNIPLPEPLLRISPVISTTQLWLDTQTLALASSFASNQRYSILVPTTVRDISGRPLESAVTHTFTTRADHMNAVTPADGTTGVGSMEALVVTMSGVLDEKSIRRSITITPPTEVTYEVLSGPENTSQLTIRPVNGWQYDSAYRVSFVDIGSQHISATTSFRTAPALALVAQSPPDGQPLQAHRELRFVFNAPLDSTTAAGAVHFSPEPIRPPQIDVRGNDIRILGTWATQTAPVVRIDTSLRSSTGNYLQTDILQTFAIDPRATQLSLPGDPADIVDTSQSGTLRINVAPHTTATLTLTALTPATFAHVRALTPAEFASYDPLRYGILPVATIPVTTELEPSFTLDIAAIVPDSVTARVVLARIVDTKGGHDTRFVRVLPASVYALVVGNEVVMGAPIGTNESPHRFDVYQNGMLVATGTADDRGIWHTTARDQNTPALIVDTTVPYDIVEHTIRQSSAVPLELDILSAQNISEAGESLPVACARSSTGDTVAATVTLTSPTGTVISARALLWNAGQRIASTVLTIPSDTQPGMASLSCVTATERAADAILIAPTEHFNTHIERTSTAYPGKTQIRLRDAAQRLITDARVYWRTDTTYEMVRTDSYGSALIPDTVADAQLVILTDAARAVIWPPASRGLRIDPPSAWYEEGQPFALTAHLDLDYSLLPSATVDVTVQDARDNIRLIRTLRPDDTGTVTATLTLPRGEWFIVMRAGLLTARTAIHVGVLADDRTVIAQDAPLMRSQTARWLTAAPPGRRILIASMRDAGVQSTWAEGPDNGILTTAGITDTTTIDYGYATLSQASHSGTTRVIDPACTNASVSMQRDEQVTRILLNAPSESTVALAITNPMTGATIWRSALTVPADGLLSLTDALFAEAARLDVRALIAHPWCQHVLVRSIALRDQPMGVLDAPAAVVIGDLVAISYTIRGLTPTERVTVQLGTDALLITDPLPTYTQTAAEDGTVKFQWNMRVVRAHPSLDITAPGSGHVRWQPAETPTTVSNSPDGFLLTGRTTLVAGRLDTPFDVLRSTDDFAVALDDDTLVSPTAAHLAHLIWLRRERHNTDSLQRTLLQAQHKDGTWAFDASAPADALVTADVVSALSHVEGMQNHITALIPPLQRAANNPALPLAVRALVVRALAMHGIREDEAMHTLYALRDTLGNEGLAAVLLSTSLYPDIDPAPVLATLTRRALPASRGVQWVVDPATANLHSAAAQNMLIATALYAANTDPTLLADCRSFLLSLRGTGGWGDAIANARAWELRSFLVPELTATQRVTVSDGAGHLVSTSAIVHGQRIRGNASIWSDKSVLIGIDYPRDPIPPTQAVVIRQQWRDEQGMSHTRLPRMQVGQSLTIDYDVVVMNTLPYAQISLPIPANADVAILALPSDFTLQSEPSGYTFRLLQPQPGVWRIRTRLTAIRPGSVTLLGVQVTDAAGTTHTRLPTSSLYVSAP